MQHCLGIRAREAPRLTGPLQVSPRWRDPGQPRSSDSGRGRSTIDHRLTPLEFRIADTFVSLARLNGAEQKAVKTTAFDLQLNLANPGLRFHRLERPRPKFLVGAGQ